ncbi:hypothetical protein OESDEN_09762 [Oesophagostomum dentatum]|uniref:Uncharacterized protein n=1 Tax=Oesophagostomum dentatum TaxID=61180 RepID=A0A0B1T3M0_OESDE|nr:hypothetical protein OESDEN_09762 [Oesophagostomum dentatum]
MKKLSGHIFLSTLRPHIEPNMLRRYQSERSQSGRRTRPWHLNRFHSMQKPLICRSSLPSEIWNTSPVSKYIRM